MPSSSSAARDAVDRLRTATIPALTVGVVAVLVLYAALAGLAGGEPMALGDALVVCAFALMTAHVAAADYPRYARLGIAWLAVVIVPAGLLVAVLTLGLRILAVHLAVIMLADSLVWALVLGVIDECAGTGRPDPTAPQTTWHLSPRFPFVEARQRRSARQAPPATGGALASLVVLAVVEFAGAEAARAGGARGLLHPAPFAMLALGGVGALASLSRLVQQVGDTRRSVQITEGFVDSWVRGALAVLGVCALIALLVPKQLVTEPLRPLRESLWGQMRNTEVRYGDGRQQRPMPLEGLNRAERARRKARRRGRARRSHRGRRRPRSSSRCDRQPQRPSRWSSGPRRPARRRPAARGHRFRGPAGRACSRGPTQRAASQRPRPHRGSRCSRRWTGCSACWARSPCARSSCC